MHIAICDDNEMSNILVRKYIIFELRKKNILNFRIDTFVSARDFFMSAKANLYTAAFLDINMPEINGFDLARAINRSGLDTYIIFVSNYPDLVYCAFPCKPLGYVRKGPAFYQDMHQAIETFLAEIKLKETAIKLHSFSFNRIKYEIPLKNIFYFHYSSHKIIITTSREKFYEINTIENLYKKLKKFYFARVDQSNLINCAQILQLRTNECEMINGTIFQISKTYKSNFFEIYFQYCFK